MRHGGNAEQQRRATEVCGDRAGPGAVRVVSQSGDRMAKRAAQAEGPQAAAAVRGQTEYVEMPARCGQAADGPGRAVPVGREVVPVPDASDPHIPATLGYDACQLGALGRARLDCRLVKAGGSARPPEYGRASDGPDIIRRDRADCREVYRWRVGSWLHSDRHGGPAEAVEMRGIHAVAPAG